MEIPITTNLTDNSSLAEKQQMIDPLSSMQAALAFGKTHPNPTIRQYAASAQKIFDWRGLGAEDLAGTPAHVSAYLELAPKFDKRNAQLVRQLIWKVPTYKQYQRNGRLLVEHFTGELAARRARQAVADDTWARLASGAAQIAEAGLFPPERLRGLARIRDLSRARGIEPTLMTADDAIALRTDARTPKEWGQVVHGAALIDHLRAYPTLAAWLPPQPIGPIRLRWNNVFVLPPSLEAELTVWLRRATTEVPDGLETEEARELFETELSKGARGVFKAAFAKYLETWAILQGDPGRAIEAISAVGSLLDILDEVTVAKVVVAWEHQSGRRDGIKPRTMFRYLASIAVTLARSGYPKAAATAAAIINAKPILREGRAAGKRMSQKTQDWCRDLIADPEKVRRFETQHMAYARRARQALADAAGEGFDLVVLASDPEQMAKLGREQRRRAKALLRRARMFGVCAAFAAISLEGAPFRQENTLGLMRSGTAATFFDHSRGRDPHLKIVIPNELLKNGKFLTLRGQTLPPIFMRRDGPNDVAVPILRFYIDRIRPLFPKQKTTSALFPSLDCAGNHFCNKTFGNWLLECSTEIGLPLTSHNFRHGRCTIEINDDPACIDRLALYLGDKPETIRTYYAFLDAQKIVDGLQSNVARRRAAYGAGRGLVTELAA
jgi:hypothetical protein